MPRSSWWLLQVQIPYFEIIVKPALSACGIVSFTVHLVKIASVRYCEPDRMSNLRAHKIWIEPMSLKWMVLEADTDNMLYVQCYLYKLPRKCLLPKNIYEAFITRCIGCNFTCLTFLYQSVFNSTQPVPFWMAALSSQAIYFANKTCNNTVMTLLFLCSTHKLFWLKKRYAENQIASLENLYSR